MSHSFKKKVSNKIEKTLAKKSLEFLTTTMNDPLANPQMDNAKEVEKRDKMKEVYEKWVALKSKRIGNLKEEQGKVFAEMRDLDAEMWHSMGGFDVGEFQRNGKVVFPDKSTKKKMQRISLRQTKSVQKIAKVGICGKSHSATWWILQRKWRSKN